MKGIGFRVSGWKKTPSLPPGPLLFLDFGKFPVLESQLVGGQCPLITPPCPESWSKDT